MGRCYEDLDLGQEICPAPLGQEICPAPFRAESVQSEPDTITVHEDGILRGMLSSLNESWEFAGDVAYIEQETIEVSRPAHANLTLHPMLWVVGMNGFSHHGVVTLRYRIGAVTGIVRAGTLDLRLPLRGRRFARQHPTCKTVSLQPVVPA